MSDLIKGWDPILKKKKKNNNSRTQILQNLGKETWTSQDADCIKVSIKLFLAFFILSP